MMRLFRVAVPTGIFVLLVSEFLLLAFCYVVSTYLLLQVDPTVFLWYDGGLARILVVIVSVLIGLHFMDLYSQVRTVSKVVLALEIGQAVGFAFLVQAFLAYLNEEWMLPRWVMIWGSGFALVFLTVWRLVYGAVFRNALGVQRVLFVGLNPVVREIAAFLAGHPGNAYANLGYLDDASEPGTLVDGAQVLGPIARLRPVVAATRPDRIVVGMTERRDRMPLQELLDLRFSGIVIEEAGAAYENACGRISTKVVRPAQLIFSGEMGPTHSSLMVHSFYGPVLALVGTVLTLPVMLLAALAIRLSSRGPVLYRQTRVGLKGAPFTLYKFRSMRDGAEATTGAVWAAKNDPRITPVGRWLRLLRIDELPQLWNVLRGEMVVVGPRPERPEFVQMLSEQIPYYRQRHCIKPGITGWAQINHKYGDTLEDTIAKLEYDLYYIKHISLSLDLYIIFQTLKTMLRIRGAQ
jgi:sugar transferase (PEP-CTERM system associated)